MKNIGKVFHHGVDNYDAMGWRIGFTIKVGQPGLEIRWKLEVKVPDSFNILENGIETGKTVRQFEGGGVITLYWWQITPFPTPKGNKSKTIEFSEN